MQETEKQEDERKLREEMLRLSEATCTPVCVKEPSWGGGGGGTTVGVRRQCAVHTLRDYGDYGTNLLRTYSVPWYTTPTTEY